MWEKKYTTESYNDDFHYNFFERDLMGNKYLFKLLTFLNKILPKYEQVLLHGNTNLDDNTLSLSKYIFENYKIKIYLSVTKDYMQYAKKLMPAGIMIIQSRSFLYFKIYLTSRYIFFTTGSFLNSFSKRQIAVNIWHGILYKRVKKLRGLPGIPAQITVSTSPLTQAMFSEAFGVPVKEVVISGYPRNDVLLSAKEIKTSILKNLKEELNFQKVIIWMPTFRQTKVKGLALDGKFMDNPFNLDLFEVKQFNELLRKHNVLCLIKPHPVAKKMEGFYDLSHLRYIDDKWIANKGITLYQLVACSDILISDVSSIIADYLLLDNPILCVCSDLDTYKNTRGFYFDNIEEWLPGKVLNSQKEFFDSLDRLLTTGIDDFVGKRSEIKDLFFSHKDSNSSKRLTEYIFNKKVSKK